MTAAVVKSLNSTIEKMLGLESALGKLPGARFGDDACDIEHFFADGLYIRLMRGKKGDLVVTKLHKTNHPYFVLYGDVTVTSSDETKRIVAPCFGITKAGTKRVAFFHEDTVWITVHATKERNLENVEREVIAETYEDLPECVKRELVSEGVSKCLG